MLRRAGRSWVLIVLVLLPLVAGCTGGRAANLLENGSFEEGEAGWFWLEDDDLWVAPFEVSDRIAHHEAHSLRTALSLNASHPEFAIVGAIQELSPQETGGAIPGRLSGAWYVERWDTNVEKSYYQLVIGLLPRENASDPICPGLPANSPCQLAFILGGVDDRPLPLANRQYVIVEPTTPRLHEWVEFDFDLRDLFRQAWGVEPTGWDRLWIYLEVRYETPEGEPGDAAGFLDVYWDDLYLG